MLSFHDILFAILIPCVIGAVVCLVAWRGWRRDGERGGMWGPPLAIGAGLVVAFIGTTGVPSFPPRESNDWVVFFAPALVVIGLLDALMRWPTWLRVGVALLISIVATALVLRPYAGDSWLPPAEDGLWAGDVAAAMFVAWLSLDALTTRVRGASMPIVLTIVAAVSAMVLMMSGSQKFGMLGLGLAAACGGCAIISLWARDVSMARGMALVFTVLWLSLLLSGHFFAEMTPLNLRLLYVAPFLAWAVELFFGERARPGARFAVRIIAVLIPLTIVVILAARAFTQEMSHPTGNMGY